MAADKDIKWIYSKQTLEDTPSRKDRIDPDKELSYRQQAANLIQDMGQRLSVNQLTINTAIVYMHRFYVYHSFTVFSRYAIAPTALFLAAKVEEQPKKLEHVLKICHACLHPDKQHLDTHSDAYLKQTQELVQNELVLLQTLGFDISVDHPHTHVVKCTQLVKASRDLSQMAYFMATNSLHLTTFCLLYKPTVVAAMCIHLSCKWSNYEIPLSSDGKPYWAYMDPIITESLLDKIVSEFLKILGRCPTRLRKLKNYRPSQSGKDEHEVKEDSNHAAPQQTHPTSQGASQPEKPQLQPQPTKEKKPTMSYEEYKRTHPPKPAVPISKPHHHSVPTGLVKKPDKHSSSAPHAASRPNNILPHHAGQHQTTKLSHPPHKKQTDQHHSNRSSNHDTNNKSISRQTDQHHQVKEKSITKPMERPRQSKPNEGAHHQPSAPRTHVAQQNESHPDESAEVLAVSKDLEGRIHNEKMMQQRSVPDASVRHRSTNQPVASAGHSHLNSGPAVKESSHRQAGDRPSHEGHVNKDGRQLDYKKMVEMYHKHPDKLRSYLKHKAQTLPLSNEEKKLWMKLLVKDDEKRKRKAAEYQAKQQQQQKTSSSREETSANVASPGPPLTLRIKLPKPPPDSSAGKTSVAKIVASSGSDSQVSPVRPRKRAHGDSSGHSSSKHSKRSDEHHNINSNRTSSDSSSSKHKQSHSKHQSKNSSRQSEPIDDSLFQKSLSDALTKVNNNKQQAGGSGIPTVTLKRASNGKEAGYFASSSGNRHDFNPALPVSAQMPDDIFEDEHDHDSGAFMGAGASNIGSLTSGDSSQHSTPEPGEIKDDSVPYAKPGKFFPSKVPSLFSPSSDVDAKLHRTVSGYHSGTENEFSSNVILQKTVQNRY